MFRVIFVLRRCRDAEQDVAAETLCRKGKVHQENKQVARLKGVSLVVLGKPAGNESAFQMAGLEAFTAEIEDETGAEAVIV